MKNIDIVLKDSQLNIKIYHAGLQGKYFQGGTAKLIYILLTYHCFVSTLLFLSTSITREFLFVLFTNIFQFIFYIYEINFVFLIIYSWFGFTHIYLDRENFTIEKGLWGFNREIVGKTQNIDKVILKPVEVVRDQYSSYPYYFSSQEVTYVCYLSKLNPEYSFGVMCDRQELNQIALKINDYLNLNCQLTNKKD